jgi:hypothetical protein
MPTPSGHAVREALPDDLAEALVGITGDAGSRLTLAFKSYTPVAASEVSGAVSELGGDVEGTDHHKVRVATGGLYASDPSGEILTEITVDFS